MFTISFLNAKLYVKYQDSFCHLVIDRVKVSATRISMHPNSQKILRLSKVNSQQSCLVTTLCKITSRDSNKKLTTVIQ